MAEIQLDEILKKLSIKSDDDPSDTLPADVKQVIRSYMLKVVTPSAIILSVISAGFGFLINEWARGEAYVKAYGEASKSILDTAQAAGVSKGQTDLLLTETKESAKIVAGLKDEITQKKFDVEGLVKGNFDSISQSLLKDQSFKASLAGVNQEQLKALSQALADLKANIAHSSPDLRNVVGLSLKCPDGYYLSGITFQDQAGLGHGALWGPSATCAKPFTGTP